MELLTIGETAHLLKVTPTTVRRYIAAGRLPAVRLGEGAKGVRIRMEAVEGLLSPITPHLPGAGDREAREQGDGPEAPLQAIPRPLTAQDRARGLAVVETLERLHDELLAKYGGRPFTPSSGELLNEARDQRGRDLG